MKIYQIVVLILFSLHFGFADGPTAAWIQTYDIQGTDEAYLIRSLPDGDILVAGSAYLDGFVMRLDSLGNVKWKKILGGNDWDEFLGGTLKRTGDGYLMVGFTRSYTTAGDNDMWIVEIDTLGNPINSWHYGSQGMYDNAYDIKPTSDGGYIVVGDQLRAYYDDWDIFLVKLHADMTLDWSTTIGTAGVRERGYSVVEMPDGGFLICGEVGQLLQQDDLYIVRTDANGAKLWEKVYGGIYDEEGFDIHCTPDGNYVISGQSWSWGYFNGYADMFMMKIDAQGNPLWADTVATFGGPGGEDDSGHQMAVTADNEYAEVGNTRKFSSSFRGWLVKADANGSLMWETTYFFSSGEAFFDGIDITPNNEYLLSGYTGDDILVVKTVPDTSISNHHPFTQPDSFWVADTCTMCELPVLANDSDPDGDSLYIGGIITAGLQGTIQINSDSTGLVYFPPANFQGTEHFAYTVYDGRGGMRKEFATIQVNMVNGVHWQATLPTRFTMEAFPNPFNSRITFSIVLSQPSHVELLIYSVTGQEIVSVYSGNLPAGDHRFSWEARNRQQIPLPSGIYLAQLITDFGSVTRTLVLRR